MPGCPSVPSHASSTPLARLPNKLTAHDNILSRFSGSKSQLAATKTRFVTAVVSFDILSSVSSPSTIVPIKEPSVDIMVSKLATTQFMPSTTVSSITCPKLTNCFANPGNDAPMLCKTSPRDFSNCGIKVVAKSNVVPIKSGNTFKTDSARLATPSINPGAKSAIACVRIGKTVELSCPIASLILGNAASIFGDTLFIKASTL